MGYNCQNKRCFICLMRTTEYKSEHIFLSLKYANSMVHKKNISQKLIVCPYFDVNNKLCVMPLSTTSYAFTCYAI